MAHALARPLGINPWEALLGEVRRTAGGVAWLDLKISEAVVDDDLIGDGALAPWVRMRERERTHLARVSKMAMDAAIDQQLVAQAQVDGAAIARVLLSTLEQLGLDDEQFERARGILRSQLLAIEANVLGVTRDGDTISGSVVLDG